MSVIPFDVPQISSDCAVCGSHDLFRDEVEMGGVLMLLECGRCGYRLTRLRPVLAQEELASPPDRSDSGPISEVATAA